MKRKLFLVGLCLSVCMWCTACQKNSEEVGGPDSALKATEEESRSEENSIVEKEGSTAAEETSEAAKEAETQSTQTQETETQGTEAQGAEVQQTETQESKTMETDMPEYITEIAGQKVEATIHAEVSAALTEEIVQQFEMGSTVTVDLDGDGTEEKLTVIIEGESYYKTPVIQVDEFYFDYDNMKELTRYMEAADENYFYLTDLDVTDGWIEIALFEHGPSNDSKTTFLRYSEGKLAGVGSVGDGAPLEEDTYRVPLEINGDGTIICDERYDVIQTSWVIKKYVLNNASDLNASIEEKVPEYYEFILFTELSGWNEIITELPVYGEMKAETEQVVTLPVGTKVEFTRYYPEEGWVEIMDDAGETVGWIRLDKAGDTVTLMPIEIGRWQLYEYVDGLIMAD